MPKSSGPVMRTNRLPQARNVRLGAKKVGFGCWPGLAPAPQMQLRRLIPLTQGLTAWLAKDWLEISLELEAYV